MAYNLQPLIQILEQILHPEDHFRPNWSLDPSKELLIRSLSIQASFLNDFFENPTSITGHDVRSLESRIRDAAYHAQKVIEEHLADQLLSNKYAKRITVSPPDSLLEIADREFQSIFDKLVNFMDGRDMRIGPSSSHLVISGEDLNPKKIVVGIREDLKQLKGELMTEPQSNLKVIPIVGMGGIGKTFLAQTLYDDQDVVRHFDVRAWVVISQSYNVRDILFTLLKSMGKLSDGMIEEDIGELHLRLHKILFGRRYLIVLDDMWSSETWDCIRMFFPDDDDEKNGSRILVTTRERNVAKHVAGSESLHHQMKLLNEVESWKLLHEKVFSQGSCALELEEVGKNIAKDCRGLPLAIHVVAGVLTRSGRTQEAWMQVAKDVGSTMAGNHEQISHILSLSYNRLPNYLKPCFLYMGAFPEDRLIQGSKLIKLWMAEGFLKPNPDLSFEEIGKVYLKELVERNLLSVGQFVTKSNAKSYTMHDLLRELCISKAREEKFLYGDVNAINGLKPKEMLQLRLRVHASCDQFTDIIESPGIPSVVCSILLFAKAGVHDELSWLDQYAFGLRLLKVLDMSEANFAKLPQAMERLINLRYLAANISNSDACSISNLCNLQTLIFHLKECDSFVGKVKELLHMPQLRHIKFKGDLPLFVLEEGESFNVVNKELQTLSMVEIDDSFPRILKAIPNLMKLGINCRSVSSSSSTIDLSSLSQLQILKCSDQPRPGRSVNLIFPRSLKKLMLENCNICIGHLNEIGRLPYLQVFKAKHCYFLEAMGEWKPNEEEFQQLRLLVLEYFMGLKKWIADETHYPRLEHLIVHGCDELEEIPSGMGDIPTLEIVQVSGRATPTALESAMKIQDEQIQYGNDTLQVLIITKSKELQRISTAVGMAMKTLSIARLSSLNAVHTLKVATETLKGATETLRCTTRTCIVAAREGVEEAKVRATVAEAEATLAEAIAAVVEAIAALEGAVAAKAVATAAVKGAQAKEDEAMAEAKVTYMEVKTAVAKAAAMLDKFLAAERVLDEAMEAAVAKAKTAFAKAQAIFAEAKATAAAMKAKTVGEKAEEMEEKAALARASAAVAKAKAVGEMLGGKTALVEASTSAEVEMARAKEALVIASTTVEVAEAVVALARTVRY